MRKSDPERLAKERSERWDRDKGKRVSGRQWVSRRMLLRESEERWFLSLLLSGGERKWLLAPCCLPQAERKKKDPHRLRTRETQGRGPSPLLWTLDARSVCSWHFVKDRDSAWKALL